MECDYLSYSHVADELISDSFDACIMFVHSDHSRNAVIIYGILIVQSTPCTRYKAWRAISSGPGHVECELNLCKRSITKTSRFNKHTLKNNKIT